MVIIIIFCFVTSVNPAMNFIPALMLTLSWDSNASSGSTFTVWYSTDSHESDPSTPPQGAVVVSGLNSTSVTITLPDTDNSCKPYYVWISAITPNGQQSPYSRRRQVEVCRNCGGEECKLHGMIVGNSLASNYRLSNFHHNYYTLVLYCCGLCM